MECSSSSAVYFVHVCPAFISAGGEGGVSSEWCGPSSGYWLWCKLICCVRRLAHAWCIDLYRSEQNTPARMHSQLIWSKPHSPTIWDYLRSPPGLCASSSSLLYCNQLDSIQLYRYHGHHSRLREIHGPRLCWWSAPSLAILWLPASFQYNTDLTITRTGHWTPKTAL